MLTYPMEERGDLPLYEYLYRRIRQDILSGALAADQRLPSKRKLAEHLRLSVITVENAYQQLEAEGYVYTRPKRGFFVSRVEQVPPPPRPAPLPPAAAPEAWTLDLTRNRVDTFPAATWARLTRQVLAEGEDFLAPTPHQGLYQLRRAIAADLRDFKGMAVSPEQIVVGAGAEYLYMLLPQLLGRDTVFAVEDPGYPEDSAGIQQMRRGVLPSAPGPPRPGCGGPCPLRRRRGPYLPGPPLSHRHHHSHRPAAGPAAVGGPHRRRDRGGRL